MGFQLNVTCVAHPIPKSRPWTRAHGTLVPNYSGLSHPHVNGSE